MADKTTLQILIEAKDMASATIKNVDSAFSKLQGIVTGAAFGAAAMAAVNLGKEMATLGAQASRVETGFRGLAGANASETMDKLRASSRGAIDDMSLMLSANKAMMLGVSQSADEMAQLMEVARQRGAAMGLSTQQAFSDLVTGIGRMSPMILDNLGIVTGGEAAFKDYAKSLGITADQLTDVQKKQFLVNKVIESTPAAANAAGAAAVDAAVAFESLNAQMTNFKAEVGKGIAEATAPATAGLAGLIGRMAEQARVNREVRATLDEVKASMSFTEAAQLQLQIDGLNNAFFLGRISAADYKSGIMELLPAFQEATAAAATMAGVIDEIAATAAVDAVTMKTQRIKTAVQAGFGAGMDPWLAGRTEGSARNMVTTGADRLRRDEEATREVMQRMEASAKAGVRTQKSVDSELRKGQAETRSLIEELLTPTRVTDEDMAATKLGKYTDKWDEYIRRIKAGASDAKSQWRDLIPTDVLAQGQDAVNAWVASTEKAFYAGQTPDQINWDAFIGQAREKMAQKQARENLIAEAGKRLAAAGIGAGVNAAELLGMGGGGQGAGIDAEAMAKGAAESGVGITISTTITDQIKGQGEVWTQTGAVCMSAFLTGAQGAITPETGQKFIASIWPFLAPLVKQVANAGYRQ